MGLLCAIITVSPGIVIQQKANDQGLCFCLSSLFFFPSFGCSLAWWISRNILQGFFLTYYPTKKSKWQVGWAGNYHTEKCKMKGILETVMWAEQLSGWEVWKEVNSNNITRKEKRESLGWETTGGRWEEDTCLRAHPFPWFCLSFDIHEMCIWVLRILYVQCHNNWSIVIVYMMPREKLLQGCIKIRMLIYLWVKSCWKLNSALQMESWEIIWRYLMLFLFKRRLWYSCVSEHLFRFGFSMGISRSRSVVSYTVWQDKSSLSHICTANLSPRAAKSQACKAW